MASDIREGAALVNSPEKKKREEKAKKKERKEQMKQLDAMFGMGKAPVKLDNPEKEGTIYARKLGRDKWEKDHCILRKEWWHFQRKIGENPPRRSFQLSKITIEPHEPFEGKQYTAQIQSKRGIYIVAWKTEQERESWMTAIKERQAELASKPNMLSSILHPFKHGEQKEGHHLLKPLDEDDDHVLSDGEH